MDLKILRVYGHGSYDKEHVILQATDDCDVGEYAIADTTYDENGKITNKLRHFHWFLDKVIKKGDYVSLWTKSGRDTVAADKDGNVYHRFYWNLRSSVWNNNGDAAVLFKVSEWKMKQIS